MNHAVIPTESELLLGRCLALTVLSSSESEDRSEEEDWTLARLFPAPVLAAVSSSDEELLLGDGVRDF